LRKVCVTVPPANSRPPPLKNTKSPAATFSNRLMLLPVRPGVVPQSGALPLGYNPVRTLRSLASSCG
jgi:hypothetical protein